MSISKITAYIVKGGGYNIELTEDDLIKAESKNTSPYTNNIKIKKEKPIENTVAPTPQEPKKSSNTNLKILEIQNYPIDFNKDIKEYEITVAKGVNKIVLKTETEDIEASVKITGNDDLSANGNKVNIEVTAEDDSRTTYIINVTHKEEEIIKEPTKEKTNTPKIKSDKKILKLFGIIGGVLVLLIITFTIKGIIKKKKINEMFDDL